MEDLLQMKAAQRAASLNEGQIFRKAGPADKKGYIESSILLTKNIITGKIKLVQLSADSLSIND